MTASTRSPEPKRPANGKKRSAGKAFRSIVWTCLKVLAIPIVCVIALAAGLAFGYVVLGEREFADVFQWETWRHMYDLVFAQGG
ncbi:MULTISPECIES: DNA-directed RNA polymerase subunit beta [Cohnella]|uniref:DNA-directed RNA polymerase subunit beta n=1 Tax=Cohnella TaxID=329857 RepID=UPI0009B9C7AE|nr:DNA-directed RNA polymerase subunit beta [Cohnella massiliensis]